MYTCILCDSIKDEYNWEKKQNYIRILDISPPLRYFSTNSYMWYVSEFSILYAHNDYNSLLGSFVIFTLNSTSQNFLYYMLYNDYSLLGSFVIFTLNRCSAIDRKVWSQKVLVNLLFLTICFQESWIFFCIADLQKYQHVHISNKYQHLLFLHIWDA